MVGQFNTVWTGSGWADFADVSQAWVASNVANYEQQEPVVYQPELKVFAQPPLPMPAAIAPAAMSAVVVSDTPVATVQAQQTTHIDYSGNMFDAQGNYLGTDYYKGQGWKDAKAANDNLQITYETVRAIEDDMAVNGSSPEKVAAYNQAAVHVTDALHGYELGTSGGHLGAPAAQQGVNQTVTAATGAVNTAASVGVTVTTPITPYTPAEPPSPAAEGSAALPLGLLLYGLWKAFS